MFGLVAFLDPESLQIVYAETLVQSYVVAYLEY